MALDPANSYSSLDSIHPAIALLPLGNRLKISPILDPIKCSGREIESGGGGGGKMRRASSSLICIFNCNGGCLDTNERGKKRKRNQSLREEGEGQPTSRPGKLGGGTANKFTWSRVKLFQIMEPRKPTHSQDLPTSGWHNSSY